MANNGPFYRKNDIGAIQKIVDDRAPDDTTEAVVVSVSAANRQVQVQIRGSATYTTAENANGVTVQAGDKVTMRRDSFTNRWIVISAYNIQSLNNIINPSSAAPTSGLPTGTGKGYILVFDGSNWIQLAPGTNGQLLSADSTAASGLKYITASGTGTVTSITAGTGITLTPSPITATGSVALTIPVVVSSGGTGATTLTANSLLVGNGTGAVGFLAPGSNGNVAYSNGTTWVSSALPLVYKLPVRVAWYANNITIASPGASIDSIALAAGDRVLLAGQSTGSQNGIWVWNGAATPMTRPTDYAAANTVQAFYGMTVRAEFGVTLQGSVWEITTTGAITIDTTATSWSTVVYGLAANTLVGSLSDPAIANAVLIAPGTTARNLIVVPTATIRGLAIKTSDDNATNDLLQFLDSIGTVQTRVTSNGNIGLGSVATAGALQIGSVQNTTLSSIFSNPTIDNAHAHVLSGIMTAPPDFSAGIFGSTKIRPGTAGRTFYGGLFVPQIDGSAVNALSVVGFLLRPTTTATYTGQITNMYNVLVSTPVINGATPQPTNKYGIYIENITLGTTLNYALYTNTGLVRIGDRTSIGPGVPDPNTQLNVVQTYTDPSATKLSINGEANYAFTSGNSQYLQSVRASINVNQTGGTLGQQAVALDVYAQATGSANSIDFLTGSQITVRNVGTGQVSETEAIVIRSTVNSGGGILTAHGLKIFDQTVGSAANYSIYTGLGLVSVGDRFITRAGLRVFVRSITASGNVTVATTDYEVSINKTANETTVVTLPASPTLGDTYVIKDSNGRSSTYAVTVSGNGLNIDGFSTHLMNVNFMSRTFTYDGVQWGIV